MILIKVKARLHTAFAGVRVRLDERQVKGAIAPSDPVTWLSVIYLTLADSFYQSIAHSEALTQIRATRLRATRTDQRLADATIAFWLRSVSLISNLIAFKESFISGDTL